MELKTSKLLSIEKKVLHRDHSYITSSPKGVGGRGRGIGSCLRHHVILVFLAKIVFQKKSWQKKKSALRTFSSSEF